MTDTSFEAGAGADGLASASYGPPPPAAPVRRSARSREDTAAGCEELAASDLARAAAMDTDNGRLKLEHSAASWQDRADLLQRLETSSNKRKALDRAEWERADAAERLIAETRNADGAGV